MVLRLKLLLVQFKARRGNTTGIFVRDDGTPELRTRCSRSHPLVDGAVCADSWLHHRLGPFPLWPHSCYHQLNVHRRSAAPADRG